MVQVGVPLFTIIGDNEYWVDANFKETELRRVQARAEGARSSSTCIRDHEFSGEVQSLSGGAGQAFSLLPAQNATGNWVKVTQRVPVRVRVLDPDRATIRCASAPPRRCACRRRNRPSCTSNILLCYDGTAEGRRALRQGADVAIAMKSRAYLLAICRNMLVDRRPGRRDARAGRAASSDAPTSCSPKACSGCKDHGVPARRPARYRRSHGAHPRGREAHRRRPDRRRPSVPQPPRALVERGRGGNAARPASPAASWSPWTIPIRRELQRRIRRDRSRRHRRPAA